MTVQTISETRGHPIVIRKIGGSNRVVLPPTVQSVLKLKAGDKGRWELAACPETGTPCLQFTKVGRFGSGPNVVSVFSRKRDGIRPAVPVELMKALGWAKGIRVDWRMDTGHAPVLVYLVPGVVMADG